MISNINISKLVGDRVLPPLPPFPVSRPGKITDAKYEGLSVQDQQAYDKVEHTIFGTPQVAPLRMKLKSDSVNDYWLLPVEPLISINGRNILAKRNVAKSTGRGTIKERWAQDDYVITIDSLFTTVDSDRFPREDVENLKRICEAKEPVDVLCPLFDVLGIKRIVIEDFQLPFTKGAENQNFSIRALSDDDWELLIKVDNQQ